MRENSDNLNLKDNSIIPITGFSCWGLGYIDKQHKHIGCMLHPSQNRGVDLRYRIDYGEKCSRETCEEQKVFSRLSPAEQEFWLGLSTGLDSFAYSSRKINLLFRMLNWGSEILSYIARSSTIERTTRKTFLESFPFFKTDLSPKGNAYLVLRIIKINGTGLLEYEALRKRYESFVLSLIKGLSVKSSTSPEPFTHLLNIDPLFADFLRLTAGYSRINLDEAIEIKSIVDEKLEEFQISLEAWSIIMEEKIINLITEKGPMTGSEILESVDFDPLHVWRFCRLSHELAIRIIGTRYLRFDRRIDGFARISPSLMREFLTYSIIGLSKDPDPIEDKADTVLSHIEEVSRSKSDLAYNVVSTLAGRLSNEDLIKNHTCFLIAGDIVFNMAHDVPRPERSTGKMVKGSDMDIVVVVDDKFPERLMERLDEEIYQEKYRLLLNPYMNEEIDYIVKTLDRVREQVGFDNFRHMVACKIMHEGTLLYGSDRLFYIIKTMLRESGVVDRINSLEREAMSFRDKAVKYLISEDLEKIRKESLDLFYPAEESEEFE